MKLIVWHVHQWWLRRAVLVLVATVLVEVAIVSMVEHPIRLVVWVAGSLPLSMVFFVAIPLLRRESKET